ncbi:MAG: hypothetical protein IKK21_09545 [Clostridia bacterium]|nr:hypothetical protein [Clostridia bacterium]
MKQTLISVLTVLLAVALAAGAVCLGAVRGWTSERGEAAALLSDTGSLREALSERMMDAANLLVVVSRHLPQEDEGLTALRNALTTCRSETAQAQDIIGADREITRLAAQWAESLPLLDSVKSSARDQAYITSLTRVLAEDSNVTGRYQSQSAAFNERMNGSLTGQLAMLLGVEPLPQQ